MKTKTFLKTVGNLLVASSIGLTSASAFAAVDYFLILEGIDGESTHQNYKDAIDILAWSEGLSATVADRTSGGGGAGKASAQDIAVTKFIDKSSPFLRLNLARGQHIESASIIAAQTSGDAGKAPVEVFRIDLTDVIITSVSSGGSSGDDRPVENMTLNFATVEWTYTPIDPKSGEPGMPIKTGWDFLKNEAK